MELSFSRCNKFIAALLLVAAVARAEDFDGSPWNISTGNLSTHFIQASPIGAFPRPNVLEPPPTVEHLKSLKAKGLIAYEDYIAWGAVEREPGKWDWTQHDAVEKAVHAAGLKYVVYTWVHFPPVWLRDSQKQNRTLMRCLEHDKETNYLSIFDPKTIDHYDHFYKELAAHFGNKIDSVYACILGPYGEGNYPLNVPDWINIGHCHEGFWCGDDFARKSFKAAMPQITESTRIHPDAFTTVQQRRDWINFITLYHQSLINFAEQSIRVTLKYFPKEKVRTKPGGNAGGVNPIRWGTYCPGYAKMAAPYRIVLQPADWRGHYFGDKWVATAYHFYDVPLGTEPAGGLNHEEFVRRLFSDISCGTNQLFTYEFEQHADDLRKYAHLVTGQPGDTEIAVFCPTTLYRLGGDLSPTIDNGFKLRGLTDYDVLDELLIQDGALKPDRYKALVMFQADWIDQPIIDRFNEYLNNGGAIFIAGKTKPRNVEGELWNNPKVQYTAAKLLDRLKKFALEKNPKGWDGASDGVWVTHRGEKLIMLNLTAKPVTAHGVTVPPHEIISHP